MPFASGALSGIDLPPSNRTGLYFLSLDLESIPDRALNPLIHKKRPRMKFIDFKRNELIVSATLSTIRSQICSIFVFL